MRVCGLCVRVCVCAFNLICICVWEFATPTTNLLNCCKSQRSVAYLCGQCKAAVKKVLPTFVRLPKKNAANELREKPSAASGGVESETKCQAADKG